MNPYLTTQHMWRVASFFLIMALFTISFQAGIMYEHTEAEAQILVDEFMKIIEGIDGVGIFAHNTVLALPMFLPGLGAFFGLLSAWSTGFTFAAFVTLEPQLSTIHPLSILFLTPFGLMEVTAYSLAGSRSLLLAIRMIRRQGLRRDLKVLMIEVGIVVTLLLVGGIIEYQMIMDQEAMDVLSSTPPLISGSFQ